MSQGFQIQPADAKKTSHAQTKKKDVPEMKVVNQDLNKLRIATTDIAFLRKMRYDWAPWPPWPPWPPWA